MKVEMSKEMYDRIMSICPQEPNGCADRRGCKGCWEENGFTILPDDQDRVRWFKVNERVPEEYEVDLVRIVHKENGAIVSQIFDIAVYCDEYKFRPWYSGYFEECTPEWEDPVAEYIPVDDLAKIGNGKNEESQKDKRLKPERPEVTGDSYDNNGNLIYDTWICPGCGQSYEFEYDDYNFCPECGQCIDWDTVKEENAFEI